MKRFTYLILLFVLLGCSGKVTKKLVIESDDDRFFKDTDLVINIDIDFVPPDSEILNDNDFTLDSDSYSDDNILKDNDLTTDIDAVTPDPTDLTGKANYYISFSKGNDDWSGTLPVPNEAGTDGPWKSLKMISSSKSGKYTVKAGEIVALQRGQTWFKPETNNDSEYKYAAISIHPSMTTNDKGITIGAYGSGANPIIDQGNELFALATVMVCISGGKNIVLQDLHLIAGGGNYPDAGVITLRGKKGPVENIRFERLKIDLSHNFIELSSGTGFGISIYGYENSVKDIYIVGNEIFGTGGGFPVGNINEKNRPAIFLNANLKNVTISENTLINNFQGVYVNSCASCKITKNIISGTHLNGIEISPLVGTVIDKLEISKNMILGSISYPLIMSNITNSKIANNTLYAPKTNFLINFKKRPLGSIYFSGVIGVVKNVAIKNNIFVGAAFFDNSVLENVLNNTFSNNLYFGDDSNLITTI